MGITLRTIEPGELQEILDFELQRNAEIYPDEAERTMAHWGSRTRQEALQHYLPLGWSFSARDEENKILGFFIGQCFLHLDGQPQSLWIEHLSASTLQARDALAELAYRLAREKNFQRVYFPNQSAIVNAIKIFKPEDWNSQTLFVKTTRA